MAFKFRSNFILVISNLQKSTRTHTKIYIKMDEMRENDAKLEQLRLGMFTIRFQTFEYPLTYDMATHVYICVELMKRHFLPIGFQLIPHAKEISFLLLDIVPSSQVLVTLMFLIDKRYLSLVVRKSVFGVSDQVRHKPGCTIKEDG